ncbi:unnamed protein product [Spirodela intermedia]|uniref:Ubiquitin-like protease family profile domain-containing protein n=1 Tax=Spirodela intermedia TaxID=51605 RepID=A0A7I8JBD1_SPIIN|nr:unnamed protein product [Spirodela intermedia]CAA6667035.1 unnamed protein product [Spirodela intermedia]
MERKPLDIPWKELLSDREHAAADVVVVQSSRGGGGGGEQQQALAGEPCSVGRLTDHMLEEKIERVQRHIASGFLLKLPDKGAKLLASLRSLEEERELRKSLDDEECKEIKQLPRRSSPDSSNHSSSNATTSSYPSESFGFHFSKLLEAKREGFTHQTDKFRKTGTALHCWWGRRSQVGRPRSREPRDVVFLDEEVQHVEQIREGDENDDRLPSSKEAKFYFPSRDHPECVELSQSDLKCLEPESYLSSTIMNFYILYLQKTISLLGRPRGEYHFCNTYFYRKLEEATSQKGEISKHLTKLRRWWKGVNIFEKAYIFLPIHGDLHWSLVIICIPAKKDEFGPIILHLDSLGIHSSGLIFDNVERYLKEEWAYLNGSARPLDLPISERIWRNLPRRIEKKKITVPQQKNDYDCGLFVLYFIERFIEAAPARLRREDLAMFGKKWFHPEEASGLRQRLRDLLERFIRLEQSPAGESPAD